MKSTLTLHAGAVPEPGTANPAKSTVACLNMRELSLPTGKKVLKAVGSPEQIAENGRPIALVQLRGTKVLIYLSGKRLKFIDTATDADYNPLEIDDFVLDSQYRCLTYANETLTVMTDDRPVILKFDDATACFKEIDFRSMPVFSLVTKRLADCSTRIPGRRLSREYPAGDTALDSSDLSHISADMRKAYLDCSRMARISGGFIAARFCRYRLVNRDGDNLYVAPPVLLGADDADRLTAPVSFLSYDRRNLEPLDINLPFWQPQLVFNCHIPDDFQEFVDHIEIDMTPGFHPYSADDSASAAIVSDTTGNGFLNVTAPGAWRSASAANGIGAENTIIQTLGRIDSLWSTVSAFRIDRSTDSRIIHCNDRRSVADECSALDAALADEPIYTDPTLQAISMPHSFTAGCVSSSAGVELWGDLDIRRFDGYQAQAMASELAGSGAWHAAVTVGFGDSGEQVVAVSQGSAYAPLKFNPLLLYPSPDARSMTIMVSAAGEVRSRTFPLSPDPSRRWAVYVSPGLKPVELTATSSPFIVPDAKRLPFRLPSSMCITKCPRDSSIRSPIAVTSVGDGIIKAIYPCARRNSGWEYNTRRFSVFTTAGILTAAYASSNIKTALIDNAAVVSADCVSTMDGRLFAVAGNRLLDVRATATRTLLDNIDACSIACCAAYAEIWLGGSDGAISVVNARDMSSFTRSERDLGASVGKFAEIAGRLVDLSKESTDNRYIRWVADACFGRSFVAVSRLTAYMHSDNISDLEIALRRLKFDNIETFAASRFNISGKLLSPVSLPVSTLPLVACRVDIQGHAESGYIIDSISLTYDTTGDSR